MRFRTIIGVSATDANPIQFNKLFVGPASPPSRLVRYKHGEGRRRRRRSSSGGNKTKMFSRDGRRTREKIAPVAQIPASRFGSPRGRDLHANPSSSIPPIGQFRISTRSPSCFRYGACRRPLDVSSARSNIFFWFFFAFFVTIVYSQFSRIAFVRAF